MHAACMHVGMEPGCRHAHTQRPGGPLRRFRRSMANRLSPILTNGPHLAAGSCAQASEIMLLTSSGKRSLRGGLHKGVESLRCRGRLRQPLTPPLLSHRPLSLIRCHTSALGPPPLAQLAA